MKTLIRTLFLAVSVMALTACSAKASGNDPAAQGNNPYGPQPGDSSMMRGDVRIVSSSVKLGDSNRRQALLHFEYFQPTPCFSLRVEASQPDAQNQIRVAAYAVAEKDKACTLMALATPLKADLSLGAYPKGHYNVLLNGMKAGEFDS